MIAKAKSISHGINDISYITGESRNKKHPERIFHVKDNLLPPGLDATGIWDSMRLTLDKFKKVKNSVIRIEVSPAPEHTKDFTCNLQIFLCLFLEKLNMPQNTPVTKAS